MKKQSLLNNNFLNIVPMICSLIVIMIHQNVVSCNMFTLSTRVISFFTHGLGTTAVPIFFLISGFLFFRNADSISAVFQKQKKRIKSVLMPFLAWSACYFFLFSAISIVLPGFLQQATSLSITDILSGILFYRYVFPLWYMFQLCIFILLTPIIFAVLKNRIIRIAVMVIVAALGFIGPDLSINLGDYERSLFQVNFFAYFYLGCLLTRLPDVQTALIKLAKKLPYAVLLVVLIGASFLESLLFDELIPCFNSRIAVPLVFAAFFLLMIKLCQRNAEYPAPKVSTMVIYGIHSAVGTAFSNFIFSKLPLPAIAHFAISFLAVTAVSWAAAKLMRYIKPIHWVFSGDR